MRRRFTRTASTFITLFGCVTNIVLTIQVAAAWRSFTYKGEQESEWEALGDKWQTNGVKLVWGLFFIYFALSAIVSGIGFHGVLKVRFCRPLNCCPLSNRFLFQGKSIQCSLLQGLFHCRLCILLRHRCCSCLCCLPSLRPCRPMRGALTST